MGKKGAGEAKRGARILSIRKKTCQASLFGSKQGTEPAAAYRVWPLGQLA